MNKKTILIVAIIFFSIFQSKAQHDTSKKTIIINDVNFTTVNEPAQFPGGINGWIKYLQDSLKADLGSDYIKIPKGQKSAKATVIVSFTINKEGTVSDVQVADTLPENVHPALQNEAIRVIKDGPNWIPAKQNGRLVIYRHKQSITFLVTE